MTLPEIPRNSEVLDRSDFLSKLDLYAGDAGSSARQHGFLAMDLDHFRVVNAELGHPAGDQLLRSVEDCLLTLCQQGDIVGRLGGDEFGVLIPNCERSELLQFAQTLVKALPDLAFEWEGQRYGCPGSVGVVMVSADNADAVKVLGQAESALYQAKDSGRGCYRLYDPREADSVAAVEEVHWAARIHHAFLHNGFKLMAQSIFDTVNGEEFARSLLVELRAEGRYHPYAAFAQAAGRFDLASTIDRWVIKDFFDRMERASDALAARRYDIRLSAASVEQEEFRRFLRNQLQRVHLRSDRLCFSVPPNAFIQKSSSLMDFIAEFREAGVHFALEGAGSDATTLIHLDQLPVDLVKIDRDLTGAAADSEVIRLLVKAVNDIAQACGKRSIAQGVDDERTFRTLKSVGVNYQQGDLLQVPMLVDT